MPRLNGSAAAGEPVKRPRRAHKAGHPAVQAWPADRCGRPTYRETPAGPAGAPCQNPAGSGTPNRSGPCRLHGGTLPNVRAAAAAEDRRRYAEREQEKAGLWGNRVDGARPLDQFADELARTAGRVQALEAHLVEMERSGSHDVRIEGVAAELATERGQLLRVADAAAKHGLGELDRKLAEQDAQFVLDLLLAVLADLGSNAGQLEDARTLFGWYLGNFAPGADLRGEPATGAPKPVTGLPHAAAWTAPPPREIEAAPEPEREGPTETELPDGSLEVRARRAGGDPMHHPTDPRHSAGQEGD
ncbi:hypothetical protein F1C76_13250 [Geodermatophilaceae bacterium NBWT11]|nr:hypothetical protein F1C76_13250 [Geodermatophilaceae bacterium NBWT11]